MKKTLKSCITVILSVFIFIVLVIVVMFLAKICPPTGPWPMPPWCSNESNSFSQPFDEKPATSTDNTVTPQSKGFAFFSAEQLADFLNSPQVLISPDKIDKTNEIHADGVAWYALADDMWSPLNVEAFQDAGLHLIGASMTIRHLNIRDVKSDAEMAALDINGQPIPLTKPGMPGYMEGEYFYSIFNPKWQQLLINQGKAFVDMGAEGISMDEPATYGLLVFEAGGSFDEYSLAAFRVYLGKKYSSEDLAAKFGIDDISTFNFRDYLIEKGMQESWNASSQQPPLITYEFFLCQHQGAADFLKRFSKELKEYAANTYGRQFILGTNAPPQADFARYIPVSFLDYVIGEKFYFSRDHDRTMMSAKLLEGIFDHPIYYLTEVGIDRGPIPLQTKNLFKYMFADIYSNSNAGMILVKDGLYTMKGGIYLDNDAKVQIDPAEANRYIDFMKANPFLFGLDEPAGIGVVVSVPSLVSYGLPSSQPLWGSNETFTVMEVLLNNRIPFSTITSGNGIWTEHKLTGDELSQYQVIILPNVEAISEEEVDALLDYVKAGGTVVQVDNFGGFDELGQKVNRLQLSAVANRGTHSLENGIWQNLGWVDNLSDYRWNSANDRQVLPSEQSFDFAPAVKIRDAVLKHTQAAITSDAPITVNMRRYADEKRVVLHLVNTDYDQTTDTFNEADGFPVTINVDDRSIKAVRLYDFENAQVSPLEFSQDGDQVTFTVPGLFAYSIVELSE